MRALVDTAGPQTGRLERLADPAHPFTASVTITRTSQEDYQTRQIVAFIDGIEVATLLWGDSITCDLEPGPHRIRVHNTLVSKTVDVELAPGEQAYFEAINRSGFGTLFMTLLFGIGPLYVTLKRM